jgi:hypothetical protein
VVLHPLQSFGRYVADRAKKSPALNHRKTTDSDYTGTLQAALCEVAILFLDDLIELREVMAYLRGDHADQPVVVISRQLAYQESGA